MKWLLLIPAVPLALILALLIFGLLQPAKHSVTRFVHLKQKPEKIFALLENMEEGPNWSTTVSNVERLPDRDGKPVARYTLKWGHMKMIMTQLERTPPTRLVSSMAKENGLVFGTWTYEISPENDGSIVALSENGELKNPLYRTMARMRGLDVNITQSLRDLAGRFGENTEVRAER